MLTEISIILVLVAANGVFAGAEMAIVALRVTRLQELSEAGHGGARAVLALRDKPERFLATVQIGITVVSATAAAFGGASIARRIEPFFARIPALAEHADDVALGVVVVVVSYLSIVIGELVPKSLALRSAEPYALWIGRPLLALSWLARPLVRLLTASSNLVLKPFGDHVTFTEVRHSKEELQQLVEESRHAGSVHPQAASIVSRAFDLPDLTVADLMVRRGEVVMLSRHATAEEAQQVVLRNPHSHTPVYDGRDDNIVGYVTLKDLLACVWQGGAVVIEALMRAPYFVPKSLRAVVLLRELRDRQLSFAIVVDGLGGTLGVVTTQDLMDELVGELGGGGAPGSQSSIVKESDGTALVAGDESVRDINRALDIELPESEDYTTLAGLCLALAASIPTKGQRLTLPSGTVLEIVDATPKRVRSVRVHMPVLA